MSTISIIGTGDMAAAIGGLAAKAGHTVEVMGRDAARARALAEQVGAGATTGTFGAAPAGDMVILAVPYSAVLDVVKQYGEELAGKVLVDITNPVTSDHTSFVTPGDSFGAQEIAKAAPFRCESRQGVQHPVLPRSGCRSRRGPPIGRVHRRGRRAGEGTRLGVHREPRTALYGYRAAAHGEDAGARLPAVAGPPHPLRQAHQLLNRRQPSRLSAPVPPHLVSQHL